MDNVRVGMQVYESINERISLIWLHLMRDFVLSPNNRN